MPASIQRYRFENTPEMTRAEARARSALAHLLPGREAARVFRRALEEILAGLQGPKDDSEEPTTRPRNPGADATVIPGTATLAPGIETRDEGETGLLRIRKTEIATATPDAFESGIRVRVFVKTGVDETPIVAETTLDAARNLISRVVGVPAERLGASDLLTAVEEGLLSFFAERLTAGLADRVPWLEPLVPMIIPHLVCETGTTDWGAEGPAGWFVSKGSIRLGGTPLPFRLLVPYKILEAASARYRASGDGSEVATARTLGLYWAAETEIAVTMSGRIGVVPLISSDLARLEPTDIVLVDSEGIALEDERLQGRLRMAHVGSGFEHGSILAEILEDGEDMKLRVVELVPGQAGGEEAVEQEMDEVERTRKFDAAASGADDGGGEASGDGGDGDGGDGDSPESFEGQGKALVEETPITLRVEIGRVRMTLRELAQLDPGSVLELHKNPSAPVNLVVENRVMAQGELVRVDGDLGVRILNLH